MIRLIISNSSNHSFAANSLIGKPIRISWRFIDASGQAMSGWDARKNLPFDIPAQGQLEVFISLDLSKTVNAKAVEVSLVHEFVFWGHDIGLPPITIPLR